MSAIFHSAAASAIRSVTANVRVPILSCNRICHEKARHRPSRRSDKKSRAATSSAGVTLAAYASRSHFCRKLFFAAPVRALPFLSTTFGSQASSLHFVRKFVLAAPVRALHFH